MPEFVQYTREAIDHLGSDGLLPLVFVPLLTSVLAVDNVVRILEFEGTQLGINLRFPVEVIDPMTRLSTSTMISWPPVYLAYE